jgi:hypothetical protein
MNKNKREAQSPIVCERVSLLTVGKYHFGQLTANKVFFWSDGTNLHVKSKYEPLEKTYTELLEEGTPKLASIICEVASKDNDNLLLNSASLLYNYIPCLRCVGYRFPSISLSILPYCTVHATIILQH